MKKSVLLLLTIISFSNLFSQSIDAEFSVKNMKKDFKVYKNIRLKANSGLYKYRSEKEIDSIYNWAENQIEKSKTYKDFYNIICQLSDFEGSLHNSISLPSKVNKALVKENEGYFPYPIKLIEGKWILNFESDKIPLGSEIISINEMKTTEIVKELYKYYETDGFNITGKRIGIEKHFGKYYRYQFGLTSIFKVAYINSKTKESSNFTLKSSGLKEYYTNLNNRYSKPYDYIDFTHSSNLKEKYSYKKIDSETGILTINTFAIGDNEFVLEYKQFITFLDSTFLSIKNQNIKNLIVDVRHNGGGNDPYDLVVYEYLTQRNFSENRSAWISFNKIPFIKYIDTKVPVFLRFLGVIKHNKSLRKEFPLEKDGKYFQDENSYDHKIRTPNKNAFTGNIYLLITSRVASAGSNFGSLLASNKNTTTIGEETQGGFYGHNGHTPIDYILPKSKIITTFSIVNIEQFSIAKENQPIGRGIMPDYEVTQTYEDYLNQNDTQMNFTLDLIKKRD
ncbi:S41 family peptidase [uncultured Flavobacterium sp.]|uniref:S41 family peptidase n=1 Tax=uncultured Flavobacterium sp. TaxID=165435 RepID=UPI0030ED7AEA|tara:strand:- start:394 stop:1911 length:1518 start_codon:yes stop_codon:yes gene_type:complete